MRVGLHISYLAKCGKVIIDSEDATLSKDLQVWIGAAIAEYQKMPYGGSGVSTNDRL
jgi:hypothetical protein